MLKKLFKRTGLILRQISSCGGFWPAVGHLDRLPKNLIDCHCISDAHPVLPLPGPAGGGGRGGGGGGRRGPPRACAARLPRARAGLHGAQQEGGEALTLPLWNITLWFLSATVVTQFFLHATVTAGCIRKYIFHSLFI